MSSLRRNAIANLIGRVATALLWVIVAPFVLERLGPERFGIWALFFAFTAYLSAFDLGIGNSMIRFIAEERAAGDRLALSRTLRKGLQLSLASGALWAVFILLARGWVTTIFHVPAELIPETRDALLVFALVAMLLQPANVLTGSLQGFERLDLSNTCQVAGVTAHVVALCAGLAGGGGLVEVAVAGVAGQVVTALLAGVLLRARLAGIPSVGRATGSTWRDLLRFGAALQLTNTLGILQVQAGKIMLGLLATLAMVTDYELAFRVAAGVAGLPLLLLGAVAPTVSRLWAGGGPAAVGALFTSTLRWLYTYTAIVLGLLWLVALDITRVWLGPEHDHIAGLIRIWVLSYAVHLSWSLGGVFVRCIGRPWIEVATLAASLATNVTLGLLWIPRHGTIGGVAALAVSYGTGFLVFVAASRRAGIPFGPWIRRELVPRVILAVLAVAASVGVLAAGPIAGSLPPPGWIRGVLATILYLVVFALCFLPVGDTQRLVGMIRQVSADVFGRRAAARS